MLGPPQALQGAGAAAETPQGDSLVEGPGGTAGLLCQEGFHSTPAGRSVRLYCNAAEGKVPPWQ